jgi:hypothetical protein
MPLAVENRGAVPSSSAEVAQAALDARLPARKGNGQSNGQQTGGGIHSTPMLSKAKSSGGIGATGLCGKWASAGLERNGASIVLMGRQRVESVNKLPAARGRQWPQPVLLALKSTIRRAATVRVCVCVCTQYCTSPPTGSMAEGWGLQPLPPPALPTAQVPPISLQSPNPPIHIVPGSLGRQNNNVVLPSLASSLLPSVTLLTTLSSPPEPTATAAPEQLCSSRDMH